MSDTPNPRCIEFLVVDDDELFRNRLLRALRDRGYTTAVGVADSSDIPAILSGSKVERAIVDLRIGDDDGITVLKQIRTLSPETKIVMLTGYGSIATATTAIKLGALNFLTKPVAMETILAAFGNDTLADTLLEAPSLPQVEWEHIHRVLADCQGNITHASKVLGLHRRSLQRKLLKAPTNLN